MLEKIKEEKGSITLFVLVACLFFIIILLLVNIGLMNKKTNQEKELEQIAKAYTVNETDMESAYEETMSENGYLTAKEVRELIQQSKLEIYPVGSIYISTNNQNPSEYIGGTWEAYGQGRTLVGEGTGTDSNNIQKVFKIGEIGGEYLHTLTINEMPKHTHGIMSAGQAASGAWGYDIVWDSKSNMETGPSRIGYAGGDKSHNNIQPYIVTYMWKRTS